MSKKQADFAKYPATLAEARALISETFKFNKWGSSEIDRYLKMIGLKPKPVHALDLEDSRVIIADMASAKMILFERK